VERLPARVLPRGAGRRRSGGRAGCVAAIADRAAGQGRAHPRGAAGLVQAVVRVGRRRRGGGGRGDRRRRRGHGGESARWNARARQGHARVELLMRTPFAFAFAFAFAVAFAFAFAFASGLAHAEGSCALTTDSWTSVVTLRGAPGGAPFARLRGWGKGPRATVALGDVMGASLSGNGLDLHVVAETGDW